MNTACLSIIIPTYNRLELLHRAVSSALNQTITDIEIIVVDDCSNPAVVLPERENLRVIRLESNQGGAMARNRGAIESLPMHNAASKALKNFSPSITLYL